MKNKGGQDRKQSKAGKSKERQSFRACSGDLLQSKLHVLDFLSPPHNAIIMTLPRDLSIK